jgi:hypothetical protein
VGLVEHAYDDPVVTCPRPLDRLTPLLLLEPPEELEPLEPFEVESDVGAGVVTVDGLAVVVVELCVVALDVVSFGVPA